MITQTINQARRFHAQAIEAEKQANTYYSMADSIRRLDVTYQDSIINTEVVRFRKMAEEMMGEHDDLLGQIDPDLIDYL